MAEQASNFPYARIDGEFTPFAAPSHEPRFALEVPFVDADTIVHALRWASFTSPPASRRYHGFADDRRQWLAVCPAGSFAAGFQTLSDQRLFSDLNPKETARAIRDWLLKKADYGEAPWFDGGEGQGMRIYHVAYGQEPRRFYGWTVVQPHWFEIHK